jgi:glycosyltransferase involved in cell wall biosynthesis
MNVAIVLVTHNRLEYTKKSISRLLEDSGEQFDLWDNASTDGTQEYLQNLKDPRIVETICSEDNQGQTGAMNYVWSKTKAELIGKLDNDCLVTPDWTRILAEAHKDIENLGAVACWHYPLEEFNESAVRKAGKIHTFSNHSIFRHPWVCGSGFIMKRSSFERHGPWKKGCNIATTYYFLKMALAGEINGWYYPLVLQEHMDDPKSKHSLIKTNQGIQKMHESTFSLRTERIYNMESRMARREFVLNNLFYDPWQAEHYTGLRIKFKRGINKMVRIFSKFKKNQKTISM